MAKVLGSVLLLLAATLAVLVPVFFGHALAAHGGGAVIAGVVVLALAVVFTFIAVRYRGARGDHAPE